MAYIMTWIFKYYLISINTVNNLLVLNSTVAVDYYSRIGGPYTWLYTKQWHIVKPYTWSYVKHSVHGRRIISNIDPTACAWHPYLRR